MEKEIVLISEGEAFKLTPEELVRQLREQGYRVIATDSGNIHIFAKEEPTCQCKEPNFRHDSNTYSYCATCGKPIAGKVAEKKIEPLNTDIFCKVNVIMTEAQYRVLTWDKINEIIKKMEEKQ